MLQFRVVQGPDAGKIHVFHTEQVTIGDDARNDFPLNDALVSRFHGVVEAMDPRRYIYRDLSSLNGSHITCGLVSTSLRDQDSAQSVRLSGTSLIRVGQTVIEVTPVDEKQTESPETPGFDSLVGLGVVHREDEEDGPVQRPSRQSIVRRLTRAPDEVARQITTADDRLQVLFRLSRELNALNRIEDILSRVVEATFEIFPLANFFAIVVPSEEGDLAPLYARLRDGSASDPILSQSLLREVVEKHESILYVQDHDELTQMDTRKSILMAQITACLAAPLFGQRKLMGVMQVDSRGRSGMFGYDDLDLFTLLASSTAFAMERTELTRNIYDMFEAFVQSSIAAIDSRDPATAGHSHRVADYTIQTAELVNQTTEGPLALIKFSPDELVELRYAALLHDFGKIGVREAILQKANRLAEGDCEAILQRIEAAAALEREALFEARLRHWCTNGVVPSSSEREALGKEANAIRERFLSYKHLVARLQSQSWLTDEDIALIDDMESIAFIDSSGAVQPLLRTDDVLNLRILRGTLNSAERGDMESHASLSEDYLSRIPWRADLARIPAIAGQHHEKLDGGGYPLGLGASELAPQVRILTICDIFDALTAADRPYKRSRSVPAAVRILREDASAGKLDADIVELFCTRVASRIENGTDND